MTELELIQRLKDRDETAFRELVSRFQDRIYNTALGMLQNATDAEDISQEVFIQVYRSIAQFKGESSIGTWMYRIAVTRSLDLIRSRTRKKRWGKIVFWGNAGNELEQVVATIDHPGVALDKKEAAQILFSYVKKLPDIQQTAFLLNKIEDLSYAEIAAILETTVSAVDSLLQRARQNLKKMLESADYDSS